MIIRTYPNLGGLDMFQWIVGASFPSGCSITSITALIHNGVVQITGEGFGADPGTVTIYENEDRTGTSVEQALVEVDPWGDTLIRFTASVTSFTAGTTVYVDVNGKCIEPAVIPLHSIFSINTQKPLTDLADLLDSEKQ